METIRARQWVYERLTQDTGAGGVSTLTGGNIYRMGHVAGDPSLYVVIQEVTAEDHSPLGQVIIYVDVTVQISVWGRKLSPFTLGAVMDRIHARLHSATGTTTGATIDAVTRAQILPVPVSDDDRALGWDRVDVEYDLVLRETA